MTALIIGFALGMQHGTEPDHSTAIDGLSRLRPRDANELYFAIGHGLVVALLAVGTVRVASDRLSSLGPWLLICIGLVGLALFALTISIQFCPRANNERQLPPLSRAERAEQMKGISP